VTDRPVLIPEAWGPIGGILSEPEGAVGAAALLLPGGGGARFGVNRIWARLARDLAERGIAVLRIDYPGTGDSDPGGSSEQAARAALGWLRARFGGVEALAIGSCYGGQVALRLAAGGSELRAIALITPFLRSAPARRKRERFATPTPLPARAARRVLRFLSGGPAHGAGRPRSEDAHSDLVAALNRGSVWILVSDRDLGYQDLAAALPRMGQVRGHLEIDVVPPARPGERGPAQDVVIGRVLAWAARWIRAGIPR
jgi:pimeloyl-ACP methyl ester carboxylesterase